MSDRESSPPTYDTPSEIDPPNYDSQPPPGLGAPPAYSDRNRRHRRGGDEGHRTEHVFQFTNNKTKQATLKLISSAKTPQNLPTYFENEPITGTLDLDLAKGDPILSVHITVIGRIVSGASAMDMVTFLKHSHAVWTAPEGRPSSLSGSNSWPFSFKLPEQVSLPDRDGTARTFHLPQTFIENDIKATICYDLEVSMVKIQRTQGLIHTPIGLIPNRRPPSPSILRQLAYQNNSPLLPPEIDVEGWQVFPRQKLSPAVDFEIAIAIPESYTRGTVIPLFVTLYPTQPSPSPRTHTPVEPPHVRLLRRVRHKVQNVKADVTDTLQTAVWWPAYEYEGGGDGYQPDGVRKMYGEVALKKDLKPSTAMGHFTLEYSIAVFPTIAPMAPSSSNSSRPKMASMTSLITFPVRIVTQHCLGPRVRGYAPPSYEREEDD